MKQILYNLPEAYNNSIEKLEDKLNDGIDTLTIKIIRDKILAKYDQMSVQSVMNNSREGENPLKTKTQYKVNCGTCGK